MAIEIIDVEVDEGDWYLVSGQDHRSEQNDRID
jgi:hypothetical protein